MTYFSCKYAPVELLAGFGVPCDRLDPNPDAFECADCCAHPNLCGYGKAVIEAVMEKGIPELILTDCCDVMRRVYDALLTAGKLQFLYLLPLPHKTGPAEVGLFEGELRRLAEAYETYCGRPFDPNLAVECCRESQQTGQTSPEGEYLRFTGAHGGRLLLDAVRETFRGLPVVDDTCTGTRCLAGSVGGPEDFFHWYAGALLCQEQPCLRMLDARGRNPEDHPPRGTIYHTMKFCDYYGFEYMKLKEQTSAPILKIETDATPQSSGQLKTRLDAFAETLGVEKPRADSLGHKNGGPLLAAGVDSGSTSTDAVILNDRREILGRAIVPTGAGAAAGARKALDLALADAGLTREDLSVVVTTGYGRESIGVENMSVTEITCHARGAHFLNPSARTVIDIGGQDSKVIHIDGDGNVQNFVMNDKCAAGTGRFLDMLARTMELSLEEMSELGLQWTRDVTISSMCTVFAESEVVSLVAENVPAADIIHGLNKAVAGKTVSLVKRLKGEPDYIMTGGVAQNRGVVTCLEEKLGAPIDISPDAQLCGAIGGALLGLESLAEQTS